LPVNEKVAMAETGKRSEESMAEVSRVAGRACGLSLVIDMISAEV
jgi:hypothetical protein